ncbi:MAG: CHAT domain-containing protein, partial [Myxococcota bacterium]|nr:CHAT domain-containing protein [Myxococcota bacterium]
LPGARKEGDAVMRALSGRGARLLAGQDATVEGLRAELQRTEHFHYAGHGAFHQDDPWGASLALRDDTELTIGDILALPRVPSEVVLTGCETARTTVDRPMETVGLAQAFLAAGAEAVVASTRPIKDTLGRAFAKQLYAAPGDTLVSRFARAQRALRAGGSDEDWSSFRLMVP